MNNYSVSFSYSDVIFGVDVVISRSFLFFLGQPLIIESFRVTVQHLLRDMEEQRINFQEEVKTIASWKFGMAAPQVKAQQRQMQTAAMSIEVTGRVS